MGEFFKKIQMFEFLSQSLKFIVGTFLILNSSLWSLMRFSAFLGLRYADNAITWSLTVFWHPCSLFFFCPSLLCFLNLALLTTPLRAGTVWSANNKWQLSCHWGQQGRQGVLLQPRWVQNNNNSSIAQFCVLSVPLTQAGQQIPVSSPPQEQEGTKHVAILNFCSSLTPRHEGGSCVGTGEIAGLGISTEWQSFNLNLKQTNKTQPN